MQKYKYGNHHLTKNTEEFMQIEIRHNFDGETRAQTMQCKIEEADNC